MPYYGELGPESRRDESCSIKARMIIEPMRMPVKNSAMTYIGWLAGEEIGRARHASA